VGELEREMTLTVYIRDICFSVVIEIGTDAFHGTISMKTMACQGKRAGFPGYAID